MTSGSWRRIDFSAVANVWPADSFVWIWLILGKMNSTGSSIVITLRARSLTSLRVAYSVVVFPLPVGPAHSTMPEGARTSFEYVS